MPAPTRPVKRTNMQIVKQTPQQAFLLAVQQCLQPAYQYFMLRNHQPTSPGSLFSLPQELLDQVIDQVILLPLDEPTGPGPHVHYSMVPMQRLGATCMFFKSHDANPLQDWYIRWNWFRFGQPLERPVSRPQVYHTSSGGLAVPLPLSYNRHIKRMVLNFDSFETILRQWDTLKYRQLRCNGRYLLSGHLQTLDMSGPRWSSLQRQARDHLVATSSFERVKHVRFEFKALEVVGWVNHCTRRPDAAWMLEHRRLLFPDAATINWFARRVVDYFPALKSFVSLEREENLTRHEKKLMNSLVENTSYLDSWNALQDVPEDKRRVVVLERIERHDEMVWNALNKALEARIAERQRASMETTC